MANPRINPTSSNQDNQKAMRMNQQQINTRSNPGQTTRSVGQLSSYGIARSGVNQLREGDIVRGEISDLRNNEITITLENNMLIKGQITDSSSLSIGQTAAFRMSSVSPSGLLMEALPNSYTQTELTLINKALDEAGLPATQRNQSAVKALMDNLLPINKQSIQLLMQQAYDYGTEDMDTLCIMNRQHLEITHDNVTQFSNYRNQQYQLLSKLQEFSQELPGLLDALAENGPSNAVAAFGEQLLSIISNESTSSPLAQTISSLSPSDLDMLKEMLSETPLDDKTLQMLQNGSLSQKDALILLRDAASAGTLKLPADCTFAEFAAKAEEITTALGLNPPSEKTSESIADATRSLEQQTEQAETLSQEDVVNNSALGRAGKLFQNFTDAAKNSFQTLNQNLNQMLASQESSISLSNIPSVVDTLFQSVTANGKELNLLFTYLTAEERTQLAENLDSFSISSDLKEKILSGEASTKEVFTAIRQLIPQTDSGAVAQLFQTEVFQSLFSQAMMESCTITPRQLSKEGEINRFYQKMHVQMGALERLINSTLSGDDSRHLSDQAHDMKSNIDFMKSLNETFAYLQLPLKLQNQNAHGDLYVYTQKEKRKQNSDQLSILLHLEMDHLGTINIRLEKNQQNIDAKFTLDNPASIQLIERNTHMLTDSLNEKGYTCQIKVQPQEQKENPIEDFLNTKITTNSTKEMKRFSFDIRA